MCSVNWTPKPSFLRRCYSDPEVTRYLGTGRPSTPIDVWRMMAAYLGQWALHGYGVWACEKIDGGDFIGSVGILHPLNWPEPHILYALDRPFWGQGFATEAARAARDWLFEHFSFPRAASFIRPENRASTRVVQKLGAVREGTYERDGVAYEWWVHYRAREHL
jgi:RimJ/RimL family protein N-acetyltransferase